jgi:hypothetical protein
MFSDIAVLNRRGEPVLLVEVKTRTGTSKDWAAKLRRNIMAHGLLPSVPYYMVATPDHFYLWKDAGNSAEEIEPSYEIDPRGIEGPTFVPEEKVGEFEFEIKVASWLNRVINTPPEQANGSVGELLSRSGLRQALQGGKLAFESER